MPSVMPLEIEIAIIASARVAQNLDRGRSEVN